MTEEKRKIEYNMDSIVWLAQRFVKAKFCKQECPVPQNKRGWGCGCRPISHMKECPILIRYNKKNREQFIRESKMFEDYGVKIGDVLPSKDYKDIYQKKEHKKE